jgi:diguanylate cyclase (GGDEF)-like protein/PAS domain S-box-containing protein
MSPRSRTMSSAAGASETRTAGSRSGDTLSLRADLKAFLLVSRILFTAESCAGGIEDAIRAICTIHDFSAGSFWRVDEETGLLGELARWAQTDTAHGATAIASVPPPWLNAQPVWISDLSADDLRSPPSNVWTPAGPGVVAPVRFKDRLTGVLSFTASTPPTSSAEVTDTLNALSPLVGFFCEHALAFDRLRASEQRFASTLDLAAIGIAHVADSGEFLYANPRLCQMLGYTEAELRLLTVKDVSHPDDAHVSDEIRDKLRRGEIDSFKLEKRYVRKDGSQVWVALAVAARRDDAGHRMYDVSVVEDINARRVAEERVQYLATHDALTGLPNRAMFAQLVSLASESAKRRQCKIAVLFIDLDRFKVINDTLGHEAGDILLREMAARIRECLRGGDLVARLGGDEFVMLLQDVSDPAQVGAVARHLLSAIMRPIEIYGQEWRVTASIGICLHPEVGQDEQSAIKNSDLAMYAAKEKGKNNFQFYSTTLRTRSAGRLAIETHLRHALERNELSLHYQAKVRLDTDTITGVEALLRWNNPTLGAVSPVRFIPVAEESGLIIPMGRWVLRTACAQSADWLRAGLPPVRTSVNLSMRQLQDDGLVDDIRAALEEAGLPPDRLELELTESMIMHNTARAVRVLTDIKSLGVKLAIDDFGTGYSSLAQLKRFPIDTLKVDRSFIREIPRDSEDRAITEAIIAMGKTLSLTIVAEGVETLEQKTFLRECACDEMQGYYFSTPVPPEEFALLLRKNGA